MIKLKPYQPLVKDKSVEILKALGLVYMVLDPRLGKTKTSWSVFEEMGAEEVTFLTTFAAKTDILPQFKEIGEPFKLRLYHNDEMPKLLADPNFTPSKYLIIDEGHAHGKFPEPSQRATYCLEFIARARKAHGKIYIIILSGTPCPENYVQLYHQFNFASPNPLGTIDEFLRDYVEVKIKKLYLGFNREWGKQQVRNITEYNVNAQKLFGILNKYIVSLTQEQAGFKVKPVDIMHHIDMSLPVYRYIHHISNTGTLQIGEHFINAKKGSSLKSKIHQLTGGTILLTDEEKKKNNKYLILDQTKINYIKKTFADKKIVIFYQFRAEEELIKAHFPNWTNSQHEFNESNDKVLIGQFKSIREGVDASTADCLVMYNIDYSSRTYRQARMRHIFFEREKPGEIHWIFTRNGLEDKVYEKVMNKQDYTDTCFDSDLTFFKDNNPAQLELF